MVERFHGFGDNQSKVNAGNPNVIEGIEQDEPISIDATGEIGSEAGEGDTLRIVDPGSADRSSGAPGTGPKSTGSTKRKYTKRAGKNKTVSDALVGLTEALVGLHYTLAQFTGNPELRLEQDEAEAISKAAHNVAAEYDYQDLPKITKQSFAWGNLIIILIALYSGRLYDIAQRRKQPPASRGPVETAHQGVVTELFPGGAG